MSWSKVMLEASVALFAHQCTSPFSTGRFVVNGQYLGVTCSSQVPGDISINKHFLAPSKTETCCFLGIITSIWAMPGASSLGLLPDRSPRDCRIKSHFVYI